MSGGTADRSGGHDARRMAEDDLSVYRARRRRTPAPGHAVLEQVVRARHRVPHGDAVHAAQSARVEDQVHVAPRDDHVVGELVLNDDVRDLARRRPTEGPPNGLLERAKRNQLLLDGPSVFLRQAGELELHRADPSAPLYTRGGLAWMPLAFHPVCHSRNANQMERSPARPLSSATLASESRRRRSPRTPRGRERSLRPRSRTASAASALRPWPSE